MGYGQNLKEAIERKGWSIARCAKESKISPQTLYTIIRRDTSVRYDYAIRIAAVLGIDINTLTKDNPYDIDDFEPKLFESDDDGKADKRHKKAYRNTRMNIEMDLFEYRDQLILHELITKFYILDDDGRRETIDFMNVIAMRHTDKDREQRLMEANKNNKKVKK